MNLCGRYFWSDDDNPTNQDSPNWWYHWWSIALDTRWIYCVYLYMDSLWYRT